MLFLLLPPDLAYCLSYLDYSSEYLYLIPMVILAGIITTAISILAFWGFHSKVDLEKTSAYECGFDPFSESRYKFDIKFYLVSLLFIIFDVEIIYLFPFSKMLLYQSPYSFFFVWLFIVFLAVGLIYEIRKKALNF